jgi:WD40 repeat protein
LFVVAAVLAIAAFSFARQSSNNASIAATREVVALAEADARATAESEAIAQAASAAEAQSQAEIERDRAEVEAVARATQEAIAIVERDRAGAEAEARSLAEYEALTERDNAQAQTDLAVARELAASALVNLDVDPERSILLALQSLDTVYTVEGEGVLRKTLQESRVKLRLEPTQSPGERVGASSILSPNGDLLATWVISNTEVWDAATGDKLWTLSGVRPVFNDDASRLATTEVGAKIIRFNAWDLANGEPSETTVIPYSGEKYDGFYQVSPDHSKIAIGSPGGTVALWDLALDEVIYTLETGQPTPIIHFSGDGGRLATDTTEGGPPIVWDVIYGEPVTSPAEFLEYIMTLNADGSQLMTTSFFSKEIRVSDVDSGETIFSTDQVNGTHLTGAFSRDGSRIVTGGIDEEINIWDLESGESILALRGHTGNVGSLAFNPDGSEVVSAGNDATVRIWDTTPAGLGEMLTLTGAPFRQVVFNEDGSRLASSHTDGLAHIWDAATGELLLTLEGHEEAVYRVEFSPDGKFLATAGADNTARLWDAATGETLLTFGGHGEGLVGYIFPGVFEMAFSPDGRFLATGGADGLVQVWDVANSLEAGEGQLIWSAEAIIDGISSLTFSPDGSWLVANHDATVTNIDTDSNLNALTTIWDAATGELLTTLVSPSYRSFGLAVSPDQSILTTGRAGVGSIDFWDVGSGEILFTLSDQTSTVSVLAYSPDGDQLASASSDGSVRVWDLASQTPILSLNDSSSVVMGMAFSPDGKRLVAAGLDGVARIYALDRDELLELARARVTRSLSIAECRQYLHSDTCPAGP